MVDAPLVVEKAHVLCYRTFDIAEEIHLERARRVVSAQARRLKLGRENGQYLQLPNPPLAFELGRRELALRRGPAAVEVTARLFDHGAASIILRVPIPSGTPFEALTSYREDDLVVVEWNSAFVYEPSGSNDIPDLLEVANAQLLEFRYDDELLDAHITRIHDEVQARRHGWRALVRSPYRALARETLATLVDLNEFVERVENSLKIIGDFYLAKVYEAAIKRLRIPEWQASVTRKQQLLTQTYSLLKGEVDTARSLTLELTVVLLIVLEVVFAILQVHPP